MGRGITKLFVGTLIVFLVLTLIGCQDIELREIIEGLVDWYCEDANSPIIGELIGICAANDSFVMGDGSYGPNVTQTISYKYYMSKYEITNSQFLATLTI